MDIYSSDDWRVLANMRSPYKKNVTIIKKFSDDYYKLVTFNTLRDDGFLLESDYNKSKKGSVNDQKLLNNISRARGKIFELAMCNDWQFFVTLTLSDEKLKKLGLSRYDLKGFYKYFSKWLNNYKYKLSYLLVPEKHKDGAIHFHGFISGFPLDSPDLELFTENDHLPYKLLNKIKDGEIIFNWLPFSEKFGFCDFEFIRNQEKCSSYVTKYISKELYKTIDNLGAHCYYCSTGLKRAERIIKTFDIIDNIDYNYENDYVHVAILNKYDIDTLEIV